MEFINENLVWFAVGGTILFMALIGFIAEKTDFGRKPKKVKEEKKEPVIENKPVVEEVIIAPKEELKVENVIPTVEDLMNEKEIVTEEPVMPTLEEIAPINLQENVVLEEAVIEPIVEESTIEPVVEESTAVEPAIEEVSFEEAVNEEVIADETIKPETITEEPVVEETKEEFELPTLEEVLAENNANKNQEVSEPEEQEEIDEDSLWKF